MEAGDYIMFSGGAQDAPSGAPIPAADHDDCDGPPFTNEQAAALGRRLRENRSGLPITEVDIGDDL